MLHKLLTEQQTSSWAYNMRVYHLINCLSLPFSLSNFRPSTLFASPRFSLLSSFFFLPFLCCISRRGKSCGKIQRGQEQQLWAVYVFLL